MSRTAIPSGPILLRLAGQNIRTTFTIFHSGISNQIENDTLATFVIKKLNYRLTPVFRGTTDTTGSLTITKVPGF